MIKLLRVDDRVLHGQVAFSWLSKTNAKCILVASDKYASNPMLKMSLNIGKPPGVDLKILGLNQAADWLNNNDNSAVMVICEVVPDALKMCELAKDQISEVCLGGVRDGENKKLVYRQVYLNEQEISMVETMVSMGIHVFAQDVPISNAAESSELISKFKGE